MHGISRLANSVGNILYKPKPTDLAEKTNILLLYFNILKKLGYGRASYAHLISPLKHNIKSYWDIVKQCPGENPDMGLNKIKLCIYHWIK